MDFGEASISMISVELYGTLFVSKKLNRRQVWNLECDIQAQKNMSFRAVDNFRQRGAEFWERPSRRHFMDPERCEKVENLVKKKENLEVVRAIVSKIV